MKLTFLGTASSYPSPTRTVSGIILHHEINGHQWLFDCGEGTQVQIQKLKNTKFKKITRIFITHLHGDHVYGLPGLLSTMAQTENDDTIIHIYGPIGLRKLLRTCLGISHHHLNFKYSVHEIPIKTIAYHRNFDPFIPYQSNDPPLPYEIEGDSIEEELDVNGESSWRLFYDVNCKTTVWAISLMHSIPSLGFVILSNNKSGQLDIEKAMKYGVPRGPLLGQLKKGDDVVLPSGEIVYCKDVVSDETPGIHLAILGDTRNSDSLISFMKKREIRIGSFIPTLNYLVHECTFENGMEEHCMRKGHSNPKIVSELAHQLNVGNLILTHFSQRYANEGEEIINDKKSVSILRDQVLESNVYTGNVILAEDLMSIDLK